MSVFVSKWSPSSLENDNSCRTTWHNYTYFQRWLTFSKPKYNYRLLQWGLWMIIRIPIVNNEKGRVNRERTHNSLISLNARCIDPIRSRLQKVQYSVFSIECSVEGDTSSDASQARRSKARRWKPTLQFRTTHATRQGSRARDRGSCS